MLNLRQLLTREELAHINARLDAATWVDGRETASGPTRKIKNNLQVGIDDPVAHELGERVRAALLGNDLFRDAAFPERVGPIRFAAYRPGMTYGWHADLAHMRLRFAELLDLGQGNVTVCEVSYIANGFKGKPLPGLRDKDFVTQGKNAEMVEECERYVVL